jgi:hypothetical protein
MRQGEKSRQGIGAEGKKTRRKRQTSRGLGITIQSGLAPGVGGGRFLWERCRLQTPKRGSRKAPPPGLDMRGGNQLRKKKDQGRKGVREEGTNEGRSRKKGRKEGRKAARKKGSAGRNHRK